MTGQKNTPVVQKRPGSPNCRADRKYSPDLTWLSLVGLHLCRARLCFTRHAEHSTRERGLGQNLKTRQTRPPGPVWHQPGKTLAIPGKKGENRSQRDIPSHNQQLVPLLVLTRPFVAGFNAPNDNQSIGCHFASGGRYQRLRTNWREFKRGGGKPPIAN